MKRKTVINGLAGSHCVSGWYTCHWEPGISGGAGGVGRRTNPRQPVWEPRQGGGPVFPLEWIHQRNIISRSLGFILECPGNEEEMKQVCESLIISASKLWASWLGPPVLTWYGNWEVTLQQGREAGSE